MTAATDLCGVCDKNVLGNGTEEFYYEDWNGGGFHVKCKPRKGTDMAEDPNKRGIVTLVRQGDKDGRRWAFFKIDGHNEREDPSYSLDMRQPGAPVPNEGDSIYFTYQINGNFNNVQMFEKVEPVEGEVEKVAATVTAREEGIFHSVALQQAVALMAAAHVEGRKPTLDQVLAGVEKSYLKFLRLLTNPASLREPGDVDANAAGAAPKPVLDHNAGRGDEGYLVKTSAAEARILQDTSEPITDPAHPGYVERHAPA